MRFTDMPKNRDEENCFGPVILLPAAEVAMIDDYEATKEPLRFDVELKDYSGDLLSLAAHIKQVAERRLFQWSTFSAKLPDRLGGNNAVKFADLFVRPNFDELEEVAVDAFGNLRPLTAEMMLSIRQRGVFAVPSKHFPDQQHRWKVSNLFQKGSLAARDTMLQDLAFALKFLFVFAHDRIVSNKFSVSDAYLALRSGLWNIFDIILGMPSRDPVHLVGRIAEERMKYLVAELLTRSAYQVLWKEYCTGIAQRVHSTCEEPPAQSQLVELCAPPYIYQTPKGLTVDFRLCNSELFRLLSPVIANILSEQSKGWFIDFRERMLVELQAQKISFEVMQKRISDAAVEEYTGRVFDAILNDESIKSMHPSIEKLLVEQAQFGEVLQQALETVRDQVAAFRDEQQRQLQQWHPVLCRIDRWLSKRLAALERNYIQRHRLDAHVVAIERCEQRSLQQHSYFLQRDLAFFRDREPVLTKELCLLTKPTRVFDFKMRIWLPSNWRVLRCYRYHQEPVQSTQCVGEADGERLESGARFCRRCYGRILTEEEAVPTVLVAQLEPSAKAAGECVNYNVPDVEDDAFAKAPLTTGDAAPSARYQVTYDLQQHTTVSASCGHFFWRWWVWLRRTYVWTWNAMFWLGVVVPLCSPVSVRALFGRQPFYSNYTLSQRSGRLYWDESSKTPTLVSRVANLWRSVAKSRRHFESLPDRGLLSKNLMRHFNRLWNYGVKGVGGSALVLVAFPPLCLVACVGSLLAAVLAPLWMPLVTLARQLFVAVLYDLDSPNAQRNRWLPLLHATLFQLGLRCGVQALAASVVAFIGCPLLTGFIAAGALVRCGVRNCWDSVMFNVVIKRLGRVPAHDSFVARRVAGPGLAAHFFYQIRTDQAVAAAQAMLLRAELDCWEDRLLDIADAPCREYRAFVQQCFGPYGAAEVRSPSRVFEQLCDDTGSRRAQIRELASRRRTQLTTGLDNFDTHQIKLAPADLKRTITAVTELVQRFYPQRIFPRLSISEAQFWEQRDLQHRNWNGLACQLLCDLFSADFLTPLEDADVRFCLEVDTENLSRIMAAMDTGQMSDPLDNVVVHYVPQSRLNVAQPHMAVQMFQPAEESAQTLEFEIESSDRPWRSYVLKTFNHGSLLRSTFVLPHAAVVALLVHNREHEASCIDLHDGYVADLLAVVRHLPVSQLAPAAHPAVGRQKSRDRRSQGPPPDAPADSADPAHLGPLPNANSLADDCLLFAPTFTDDEADHSMVESVYSCASIRSSVDTVVEQQQQQQQQQRAADAMRPSILAEAESTMSFASQDSVIHVEPPLPPASDI